MINSHPLQNIELMRKSACGLYGYKMTFIVSENKYLKKKKSSDYLQQRLFKLFYNWKFADLN